MNHTSIFFCITNDCQLETLSQAEIKKLKQKSGTKSAQNTSKYSEEGSLACLAPEWKALRTPHKLQPLWRKVLWGPLQKWPKRSSVSYRGVSSPEYPQKLVDGEPGSNCTSAHVMDDSQALFQGALTCWRSRGEAGKKQNNKPSTSQPRA